MEQKIAIVGMGTLFPDAVNVQEFWQNILSRRVSIKPLPDGLFESEIYYRPELISANYKEDKSITRLAGWIDSQNMSATSSPGAVVIPGVAFGFDTVRKYKIPPSVAEHMDSNQHAALYTTAQALEMNGLQNVAKDRVAVIFGNGMVGTRYGDAMFRVQFQQMEYYLKQHPDFQQLSEKQQHEIIDYVRANVLKGTIPISEDSAPGVLPNLIAGRIANVYDFHGPSFTVDAACASVLTALITGIQGLQLQEYDAVICGGADMPLKQLGLVLFSAMNALSPDGSFPFDRRANGFVMGQGAGTVLLKRLEDAVRDQDSIYAVITGYGEASDGKGKYIAAPNAEWQARTIQKACRMAGYPVDTIEMIEAHGTATRVGDVVEVQGLKRAFQELGATRTNYCGLTSVKSNIGHLKSAAGIAGLIKAVLALHHKILPPTASFAEINPNLELDGSPFYVLDEQHAWEGRKEYPRRANVSSFGFGGADYHVTLEEYREEDYRRNLVRNSSTGRGFTAQRETLEVASPRNSSSDIPLKAPAQATDSTAIPELLFFSAETLEQLDEQVQRFQLEARQANRSLSFREYGALHNEWICSHMCLQRLALLGLNVEEIQTKYNLFLNMRAQNPGGIPLTAVELLRTRGVFYKQAPAVTPDQTAILFPGQASQYVNMLHGIYEQYDLFRTLVRRADAYWFARHAPLTVSELIYPAGVPEAQALERLRQTEHAHPAIFITSYALWRLLQEMGLIAHFMAGHSLGEITALVAAGAVSFENALRLIEARGYAFADEKLPDPGKMISVMASQEEAQRLIQESGITALPGSTLSIANLNSPTQSICAGSSSAVDQFKVFLDQKKITNKLLFVSHAFHTALLQPVAERFYSRIHAGKVAPNLQFQPTTTRVMMNQTGQAYPQDETALTSFPQLLRDQIVNPVNFIASIENLYRDGVRLFVEVGPGSILSSQVKEILKDKPEVVILAANYKNMDDRLGLQRLLGALFVEGVPVRQIDTRNLDTVYPAQTPHVVPEEPAPTQALKPLPSMSGAAHSESAPRQNIPVYSGVAIGLPGSYKDAFRDDNFDQLFEGRNLIERLTDEERQTLVDLQITKLVKDESGPTFKLLSALDEVIQLAGKIGKLDLLKDYHIDEKLIKNMSSCIAHGVAAGYEALKDAHIPLVREYMKTSTGKLLPQKLALPREMQDETGVIFANGFPLIDPVITEVSRYISYAYGSRTRRELMAFYEAIIQRVTDPTARKLLTDWYTLYYSRLNSQPGQQDVYHFNHQLMNQISAQANNLLALLINARGPNFQLNAACSSTSNAITIAEDFIRTGRVKRMLVVGADDPTSKTNFPWLGAGFLATGAATNVGDLYEAAVPFDRRRNGMIAGAGAVGIVLETRAEVQKRGMVEICELLGSHSFNTAKHISQIDVETFSTELDRFISRMEQQHPLHRDQLAAQTVYISHETYTPPRGGCSQTEAEALRRAFGKNYGQIIVGNTKGMTGHTMGASIEDAIAAKALQYGKCPPVVNLSQLDPMLEGLNLFKGGEHNRTYALKMSAGFGAQGHFVLLRKVCNGDSRIVEPDRYQSWLASVTDDPKAVTEVQDRILVARTGEKSVVTADKTSASTTTAVKETAAAQETRLTQPRSAAETQPVVDRQPNSSSEQLSHAIVDWLAEQTHYPPEMLEPEMEFSADLGIDGVKTGEILSRLAEKYALPASALTQAAINPQGDDFTVGQLIEQVTRHVSQNSPLKPSVPGAPMQPAASASVKEQADVDRRPTSPGGDRSEIQSFTQPLGGALSPESVQAEVLKVFSEVTKYPVEMLELDMDMEADLGIDTVKQATILSMLGEKYGLERQPGLQLSKYPTIRHIVGLIMEQVGGMATTTQPTVVDRIEVEAPAQVVPAATSGLFASADDTSESIKAGIVQETLKIFSEVTKYPQDMLELDMNMEADLGIDTVKQATILSILGEKYGLERQPGMQLSKYPTIRALVDLIYEQGAFVSGGERSQHNHAAGGVVTGSAPVPVASTEVQAEPATALFMPAPIFSGPEPAPVSLKPAPASTLSRQVPVLAAEGLGEKNFDLAGKVAWVFGDQPALVEQAIAFLEKQGAKTAAFIFPQTTEAEEIERAIATFLSQHTAHNKCDVLLDCTHIGGARQSGGEQQTGKTSPFAQLNPEEAQASLFMSSTARFVVYKYLSAHASHPGQVICLTAIDGALGLGKVQAATVNDPTYGALLGFYKGLRKEWTDSQVRIIDFAPSQVQEQFDLCLERVAAELEHASVDVEIAYPVSAKQAGGERWVVKIEDKEARAEQQLRLTAQDTFLITGGGTGITARVVEALAQAYPVNFILVDIVELPEQVASLAQLDEGGLAKVKDDIYAQLRQQHQRVTPVMVNREMDQLTRAVEIHRRLEKIRQLGRNVVYIACDVRDHARLRQQLEQARRQVGPVTAILHAAGIDRSHLIDQKSVPEFEQVFSVKAQGADNLLDLCRQDPVRLVVGFASIAGRFGNAAQLDYCAANSFLSYWVQTMRQVYPQAHALSLVWSGWKDVGIAWRNELVRQVSEETGLNLIDVDQGVAAFRHEIENVTGDAEVILHKGLNGFVEKGLSSIYLPDYPLMDRLVVKDGQVERAYRVFSIHRDALIDQHRLGKTPILPAVAYAELAVEYYAVRNSGSAQAGRNATYLLRDMTFENAFKLFREQPRELIVVGEPAPEDQPALAGMSIQIQSSFTPPRSEISQTVVHSRVKVSDVLPPYEDMQHPEQWDFQQARPIELPAERSLSLLNSEGPEQRIILGPLYNDTVREAKDKAPVLIYPTGAVYPAYFPEEQLRNPKYPLDRLLVNPCFLDSMYQACAAHLLVVHQRVYLPWEVKELGIVHVPRQAGRYQCYAQVVETGDEIIGFNVVMLDPGGQVCYFGRRVRFRMINQ